MGMSDVDEDGIRARIIRDHRMRELVRERRHEWELSERAMIDAWLVDRAPTVAVQNDEPTKKPASRQSKRSRIAGAVTRYANSKCGTGDNQ